MSTEEKGIDSDTLKFIDAIIADSHQEVYFKGWLDIIYLGQKKPRLVVLTNFRLYVIKTGLLGRSVRQSFLLLHLKSIRTDAKDQLTLTFDEDIPLMKELSHKYPGFTGDFTIEHTAVPTIATNILFATESIRYGRPPVAVSLPSTWLENYKSPDPDEQDGILASYLAECDRVGIPQRVPVLDYFMTCFQIDDHLFDCRAALSFLDQPCQRDILAIVSVLRYTSWFTSFVCVDFPLKNEGAFALATMFDGKTSIRKLVLVNTKLGKPAMSALAQRFANGLQDFEHIAICSNPIGNDGLNALVEGLQTSGKVPTTLLLSNNDISKAGIKNLTSLLSLPHFAKGLQVLDLSDNSLGKQGTEFLATWLSHDIALEQLFLRRTDLELERLFQAFNANQSLIHAHLALLDLTGNKLTKKAVPELASILQRSKCLSCVVLNSCQVEHKYLVDLFDAMFKNTTGVGFSIDLANNDIGSRGAKELQQFISTRIQENPKPLMTNGIIQWLNLSDNGLGNEGIAMICRAFQSTTIKSLKLDRNYKTGIFSKANEASEALAAFVSNTPGLTELSIAGDDNTFYLQKYLLPLLASIKQHPTLAYIDVSNNRIGDEGIQLVAEALTKQTALRGLNVEGSRMTLTGLSILDRAIRLNRSVVDMQMPVEDVNRIIKSLGNRSKEIEEIQNVIRSIDDVMDRNELIATYNASSGDSDEKGVPDYAARYASNSTSSASSDNPASTSAQTSTAVPGSSLSEGSAGPAACELTSVESKEASSPAPHSSMMLRGNSSSSLSRGKRMSVVADSYENMIATLKTSKTHRKMQARELNLLAQGADMGGFYGADLDHQADLGQPVASSSQAYSRAGAESEEE